MRLSRPMAVNGVSIDEIFDTARRLTILDWVAIQNLSSGIFIVVLLSLTGLPRQTFWQLSQDEMTALVDEVKIPAVLQVRKSLVVKCRFRRRRPSVTG